MTEIKYKGNISKQKKEKSVLKAVKRLNRKSKPINAGSIYTNHRALMGAGDRNFGSWKKTVEALGFDYSKIRKTVLWSKDKIIKRIKERHRNGGYLNAIAVISDENRLYCAARKYFGSWEFAIIHAGFDYSEIKKKPIAHTPAGFQNSWSRDIIKDEILRLYAEKEPLNHSWTMKYYPSLIYAAYEYFHGWENAITYAGLDYNKIRKKRGKWTKEQVIFEIKKLNDQGKPLNYSYAAAKMKSLVCEARIFFGSWDMALKAAGFDFTIIRKRQIWSKQKIIDEVRKRKSKGKSITYSAIKRDDFALFRAIQRYFRTVPKV